MAETLPELRAAEREVAREWQWLHDTLNEIAGGACFNDARVDVARLPASRPADRA